MSSVGQVYASVDALIECVCRRLAERLNLGVVATKRLSEDAEVLRVAAVVEASLVSGVLPAVAESGPEQDGLVLGFDWAVVCLVLERADPTESQQGPLAELQDRYLESVWLDDGTGDGLLPRRAPYTGRPREPEGLNDLCDNLLWVPADVRQRLQLRWANPTHDLGTGELSIGMCPMAGPEDLIVSPREHDGLGYYQVGPAPSLEDRIRVVLRQPEVQELDILLLPESVADEALLESWQAALAEHVGPAPTWILIGSGPFSHWKPDHPPFNRATVLYGGSGEIVFQQDKQLGFRMPAGTIHDWQLDDILGDEGLNEWMTPGDQRVVIESQAGRFAVVICEDLGRVTERSLVDVLNVGPTHLFVPVYSRPMSTHGWESKAGTDAVHHCGANVFVVNSLHVPFRGAASDQSWVLGVHVLPSDEADAFARTNKVEGGPSTSPDSVHVFPRGNAS